MQRVSGGRFAVKREPPGLSRLVDSDEHDTGRFVRVLLLRIIDLGIALANFFHPVGVPAVAAMSIGLKHELQVSNYSRPRAPNPPMLDRFMRDRDSPNCAPPTRPLRTARRQRLLLRRRGGRKCLAVFD